MFRARSAFTIVELLIVVVVIAILAAITIVAYNGIQSRAKLAAVQSTASQVSKRLSQYAIQNNDTYPALLSDAGIQNTTGTTYAYQQLSGGLSYCYTVTTQSLTYFALGATMMPREGSCGVSDGLTNAWQLDGTTEDAAGRIISTGTSLAYTANQKGTANYAADLNGTASTISAASTASIALTEGSVSVWIRPDVVTGAGNKFIFLAGNTAQNGTSAAASGVMMYIDGTTGKLRAGWADGNTDFDVAESDTALTVGTWYHAVLTWYTTSNVRLYMNSVAQTVTDTYTNNNKTNWANTMNIGSSYSGNYYDGVIDNMYIYNQSLSQAEVNTVYTAGP